MAKRALDEQVRIAKGTSDDLGAVMRVMEDGFGDRFGEAWTRSQLAGILPMAGVGLSLARDEAEEVIGFSLTRSVGEESELLLIAVAPERHRQGVGQLLLEDFVDRARAAGVRRVHLEVRDGNPAVAMYSAAGFTPVGRRPKYYRGQDGSRFDALTFARDV